MLRLLVICPHCKFENIHQEVMDHQIILVMKWHLDNSLQSSQSSDTEILSFWHRRSMEYDDPELFDISFFTAALSIIST